MTRIAITVGSTLPGPKAHQVGAWLVEQAGRRTDAQCETVDLREHPLPMFDEELPPSCGSSSNDHTEEWARTIAAIDGFVMVTAPSPVG